MRGDLKFIAAGDLRPHEDVDTDRLASLIEEIRTAGVFYPPVLVDDATRVILDGHHRWRACGALGLRLIPCYCVDYLGEELIRVKSRRPEIAVTKDDVLATALRGETYPHKTTRHMYDLPETIEPVPLERLNGD